MFRNGSRLRTGGPRWRVCSYPLCFAIFPGYSTAWKVSAVQSPFIHCSSTFTIRYRNIRCQSFPATLLRLLRRFFVSRYSYSSSFPSISHLCFLHDFFLSVSVLLLLLSSIHLFFFRLLLTFRTESFSYLKLRWKVYLHIFCWHTQLASVRISFSKCLFFPSYEIYII